jgi:hypothetical protein
MNEHETAEQNLFAIGCSAAVRVRGASLADIMACEDWPED